MMVAVYVIEIFGLLYLFSLSKEMDLSPFDRLLGVCVGSRLMCTKFKGKG